MLGTIFPSNNHQDSGNFKSFFSTNKKSVIGFYIFFKNTNKKPFGFSQQQHMYTLDG